MFNVVEKPNYWAKEFKSAEGLNETQKLKLDYWQSFVEVMRDNPTFTNDFTIRKASPQHWYDLSLHSSIYHLGLTLNTQKNSIGCEVYINDDKDLFHKFEESKGKFKDALGCEVEWREASKDCRIIVRKNINVKKPENWKTCFDWYLEKAIIFKKVVKELDK